MVVAPEAVGICGSDYHFFAGELSDAAGGSQFPRVQGHEVGGVIDAVAVRHRQVVDSFIGALPEAAVREFVNRLAPVESEADRLVAKGDESSLRQALELEPHHPGAVVALAELLAGRGEGEQALDLLTRVPETAEVRRVAALARVGDEVTDGGDLDGRLDGLLEHARDDEAARRELLDLLEVLGPDDPRTPRYRKALTARLF